MVRCEWRRTAVQAPWPAVQNPFREYAVCLGPEKLQTHRVTHVHVAYCAVCEDEEAGVLRRLCALSRGGHTGCIPNAGGEQRRAVEVPLVQRLPARQGAIRALLVHLQHITPYTAAECEE